ncbi:S1 family peptidase [Afipia massiliensis]|uniref:S1 family peptidase n=1 Tax=Afipia massiliensis TaxID=211460 RepID=A0A4U6BQV2_9BRAD|nr:trypsin-like serine protease [Afipia massiliensis]TKT72929.1 S1 family peptidase [Afipia massiliensis]
MIRYPQTILTISILTLLATTPAYPIVGSRSAPSESIVRAVVTVAAAGGGVCTGTMIAPNIILTAAHCLAPGTANRVIDYSAKPPRLIAPQQVAVHPRYNAQFIAAHRATADVALLRLSAPLPGKSAALLGVPRVPFSPASRFTVVGIGSIVAGSDSGVGTIRAAPLAVTGQPGTLQVRLMDPQTQNKSAGMGACTGDSGAPAFEDQDGNSVVVGVVSWSTGANNSAGCGGLTGVTPLTLYNDWIVKTARSWGAVIP